MLFPGKPHEREEPLSSPRKVKVRNKHSAAACGCRHGNEDGRHFWALVTDVHSAGACAGEKPRGRAQDSATRARPGMPHPQVGFTLTYGAVTSERSRPRVPCDAETQAAITGSSHRNGKEVTRPTRPKYKNVIRKRPTETAQRRP